MGCASCDSVSCPPPIPSILGAGPALNQLSEFWGPPHPTLNVYIDQETIDQIIAGEITPLDALQQGKIRYEGVGFVKWVKFKVVNTALRIMSILGWGVGIKEEGDRKSTRLN